MLTSGSTGNPKAVCLRHGQIISSLVGKATYHQTGHNDVFLNWIGMDHVANLTEIHLHAIALGAEQIHVPAVDLLANPLLFLDLIDRHRVSYSFAPNFFLASVKKALEDL
jgi:acyl-CoA synthetase (AMP-forming)/AMP-acid ligase II